MQTIYAHLKQNGLCYGLALLLVLGLKQYYSQANSDDLAWILSPTARIVELVSGMDFEREAGTGYIHTSQRIIIAPACAGVNFLIMAFGMAAFSFLHRRPSFQSKCLWLSGSFMSAYLLTLIVNALRILLAIQCYRADLAFGWLTPTRLHRLEGIIVYFGVLCLYYRGLQRFCAGKHAKIPAGVIPACWYVLILLVVPLINASYQGNLPRFFEHTGFILIGCGGITTSLWLFAKLHRWLRKRT